MAIHVLLLREPSEIPDKYESAFAAVAEAEYVAHSFPVLETVLTNIPDLTHIICKQAPDFAGAIITSARACEALAQAVNDVAPFEIVWSAPFYVVGKATAAALRNVFPAADIRGESSGTAEQLAHFIVDNHSHSAHPTLLYLTGDKNRDTLPSILTPTFTLQPLKVYETTGAKDIPERLRAIVPSLSSSRWWFVLFAPSSAQFTWPHLQPYCELDDMSIAAIGPTTATFLQDDLGRRVAAVAARPSPDELVKAITNVENQRRRACAVSISA